jgi:hypothetical protein
MAAEAPADDLKVETTGWWLVLLNGGADGAAALPMFVHTPGKDLRVLTAGDQPDLTVGQELIGLIKGRRRGS